MHSQYSASVCVPTLEHGNEQSPAPNRLAPTLLRGSPTLHCIPQIVSIPIQERGNEGGLPICSRYSACVPTLERGNEQNPAPIRLAPTLLSGSQTLHCIPQIVSIPIQQRGNERGLPICSRYPYAFPRWSVGTSKTLPIRLAPTLLRGSPTFKAGSRSAAEVRGARLCACRFSAF